MPRIYVENLSAEYRRKLSTGQLTEKTIESLAGEVSDKYAMHRRSFRLAVYICLGISVLMVVLTLISPKGRSQDPMSMVYAFGFTFLAEALVLAITYRLAVTWVPHQFDRCLHKGYPQLVEQYGYTRLVEGSLSTARWSRQLPFSMQVEDVFKLRDSDDVVVVGYAHGLITRGNAVMITEKDDPAKERGVAIVTALEKRKKPVAEAADCNVALQLHQGASLGVTAGMYLYRK